MHAVRSRDNGRVPTQTPTVRWEVVSTTSEEIAGLPVTTKKLLGHVDNSAWPLINVDIQLSLSTPAQATRPLPVIMEPGPSPKLGQPY